MLASMRSRPIALSIVPSLSLHARNFSAIQAARPAGQSVRANASVCGLAPFSSYIG
jgi:hypothetical protein